MRAKGLFFGKIIGFAMLIMLAMPMLSFAEGKSSSRHLVRVYDRGEEKTIVTNALTVRQALQAAKISIDEKMDTVEPNIDMELTGSKYQVNIFRARPITIVDGNKRLKITTAEQTPALIAKAAGLKLYREDKTYFAESDDLLVNGASLVMKIERAKQRTVTEEVDIDFQIEQVRDDSQPIGFKSVRQLGEKGVRKITYQVEINGEREVSRRKYLVRLCGSQKSRLKQLALNLKIH